MNTDNVKDVLFRAMQKPTKKNMAELASQVIKVCDELDNQMSLSGIIRAGNDQLEASYNMLERLRSNLNGR